MPWREQDRTLYILFSLKVGKIFPIGGQGRKFETEER